MTAAGVPERGMRVSELIDLLRERDTTGISEVGIGWVGIGGFEVTTVAVDSAGPGRVLIVSDSLLERLDWADEL